MMSEVDFIDVIAKYGFSIAVAIYLLYERTRTFEAANKKWEDINTLLLEVVRANTVAQTELRSTIQKLCEIVNGNGKSNQGMGM